MALTALAPAPSLDGEFEPSTAVENQSASWWVAVLALSLVSLGLRVGAIDHDSLWFDEAITYSYNHVASADFIVGRVCDPGNPPLYWILAGIWSTVFGDSEAGLRSFPALCGVLTVPFLALVGRRLVSPKVGLSAAFLIAISPMAVELSNEARPYALLGLLSVAATWSFVRWVRENRKLDLAVYSVAVFLVCGTHYYGTVVPLAHAAGLGTLPRERRRLRAWLGAMLVAGLLGSSVLNVLIRQVAMKGNLSRMGDRWITQFLATPMVFGFGRNLAWRDSPAWLLAAVTVAALICLWLPVLFALFSLPAQSLRGRLAGILGPHPDRRSPGCRRDRVAHLCDPLCVRRPAAFLASGRLGTRPVPPDRPAGDLPGDPDHDVAVFASLRHSAAEGRLALGNAVRPRSAQSR